MSSNEIFSATIFSPEDPVKMEKCHESAFKMYSLEIRSANVVVSLDNMTSIVAVDENVDILR